MGCFKNISYSNNGTDSSHKVSGDISSLRNSLISNVTSSAINRLKSNPFYFFNQGNMTIVTFYNINKDETTLDEELRSTNNFIGDASGLRFDKINNVVLYGLQKIELNIDNGEYGTEADSIEGEAIIPPNTFKPYQESYFTIDHLNTSKELFFRITAVNYDTLPNGANYYKIAYKLESVGFDITKQLVNEYEFLQGNIGTSNPVIVLSDTYNAGAKYNDIIDMLSKFYYELFFQVTTQTFVCKFGMYGYYFYDPYLIHFIMRNGVINSDGYDYIRVDQPAITPPYMQIDYEHTIFRKLEDNTATIKYTYGYGLLVQDPMSLLTHRISPYYMITMRDDDGAKLYGPLLEKIYFFDKDFYQLIPGMDPFADNNCKCTCNEILSNLDRNKQYYRIIYNYLAGKKITSDMINSLKDIEFVQCKELYYTIPILIYIIKQLISNLSTESNVSNT